MAAALTEAGGRLRRHWRDEAWDGLALGCPEATFFHTRVWARLILASFPQLEDRSIWVDGPLGPILLPLFAWRRAGGLLTTLHSSFPFLYGGSVPACFPQGEASLALALPHIHAPLASLRISGTPFVPGGAQELPRLPAGLFRREASTHLLPLPATEEEYWDQILTTAQRNDVRRLGKKGVAVEETRDPARVEEVYRLYLASFERWGGRPGMVYPLAFYRNLLEMGGDAVRFTVALREGRLLGGTFTVRGNGKVHYLAGYFDHESRSDRPNVLIQIDSILQAIRQGERIYDFLPSGGHASVETFKEGFGGVRATYPVWMRTGPVHRLLGRREA